MLKKLKHRLTGITMMLISVTMIITFLTLIVASSNRMVQESVKYLQGGYTWLAPNGIIDSGATPGHLDDNHIPAELINNKDMPFDGQSPFSTFYVTVDSNGDIISVADFSHHLSEEIITQALPDALAQGKDVGVIKNLNLNFAHFESENNVSTYGFIDVSYQRSMLRKQAIHYSLIGIGCLLVFFLISLFLSGLAIRPVEKAWRQQQQFVADASHELKTPITVMLANTSILLNDKTYDKKTA
ncbi:MAG: histidine kinase dimerization/phospho-acceptor domain-containing protein, partial [Eubacteriales bacterium]